MNTLMDPVFAMDETFSSSRGSRLDQLRNALELRLSRRERMFADREALTANPISFRS
jgi:hypothetical protein